jgi:carbamoyl-phosphate synthase small subunit
VFVQFFGVDCAQSNSHKAEDEKHKVTVICYGERYGLVESLNKRGCTVTVLPATATANEVLATDPDGIMLSGGAGDPVEYNVEAVKALIGKKPMFAISLGHQILALAKGAKTFKLPYGHRGASQPVKEVATGRTHITSQNHGFCVDADSVTKVGGAVTYVNGNDKTCEGVEYASDKAFSVQFIPEKAFGEDNTENVLFNKFVSML